MKTNLKNFPENTRSLVSWVSWQIDVLKWKEDFEAELQEELKKWDKDVKAHIMSDWFPSWIRKEILVE